MIKLLIVKACFNRYVFHTEQLCSWFDSVSIWSVKSNDCLLSIRYTACSPSAPQCLQYVESRSTLLHVEPVVLRNHEVVSLLDVPASAVDTPAINKLKPAWESYFKLLFWTTSFCLKFSLDLWQNAQMNGKHFGLYFLNLGMHPVCSRWEDEFQEDCWCTEW